MHTMGGISKNESRSTTGTPIDTVNNSKSSSSSTSPGIDGVSLVKLFDVLIEDGVGVNSNDGTKLDEGREVSVIVDERVPVFAGDEITVSLNFIVDIDLFVIDGIVDDRWLVTVSVVVIAMLRVEEMAVITDDVSTGEEVNMV